MYSAKILNILLRDWVRPLLPLIIPTQLWVHDLKQKFSFFIPEGFQISKNWKNICFWITWVFVQSFGIRLEEISLNHWLEKISCYREKRFIGIVGKHFYPFNLCVWISLGSRFCCCGTFHLLKRFRTYQLEFPATSLYRIAFYCYIHRQIGKQTLA